MQQDRLANTIRYDRRV